MSEQILSAIYNISKNFNDPITKLSLEQKNNNISVIVKNGNVNVSINIIGNNTEIYSDLTNKFKEYFQ